MVAVLVACALLGAVALLLYAPARVAVSIDSVAATAKADVRTFFGLGPLFTVQRIAKARQQFIIQAFHDGPRIAHALMTPQIADVGINAMREVFLLRPRVCQIALGLNLVSAAHDLVVQTATQAALAIAPPALRERVIVSRCVNPGAEIIVRLEFDASPMRLRSIFAPFKKSRQAKEFRRRLNQKPKARRPDRRVVRA